MQRKTLAICAALMALGALVLAPTMASATTAKDTVNGVVTTLPAGTGTNGATFVAYNEGTTKLTGSNGLTVECNEDTFTGHIDKNDGTEIQATIEDAWFTSNLAGAETKECKSSLGNATITVPGLTSGGGTKHWCLRNVPSATEDKWQLWGNDCTTEPGTGELTFIVEIGSLKCYFKRTAALTGTFTTNVGSEHKAATLTLGENAVFNTEAGPGESALCPASGTLSNFQFEIYTDTSTTAASHTPWRNALNTADPIFITNP
jgi:hypothetical protein